jgi:hypothetical protein
MKQCVSVATAKPDAIDVDRITLDNETPMPEPAAAPHTINTYKNDAKHSDIMALEITRKKFKLVSYTKLLKVS